MFMSKPVSARYLSFAEREEIALLRAQDVGVREIARRLGRSPSTVSRELTRNAATRGGKLKYRASVAQWKSELAMLRRMDGAMAAELERVLDSGGAAIGRGGIAAQYESPRSRQVPAPRMLSRNSRAAAAGSVAAHSALTTATPSAPAAMTAAALPA